MSESSPAPDLDLRLVRYFTMVARHRHFGRAAEALLRSAADAAAQTRAAAEPSRITIGYTTGLIVTPAVRELRHRYPDTDVRTVHLSGSCETSAALLGKRVDALVTRLPFRTDQLHVRVLYDERRVLVVPIGHRLAGKEFVTLDDIADEALPRMPQGDPVWSAFWHVDPRPDGSPAPDGPLVETVEDKFEVIAAGEAVAITAGPRGGTVRPDLTTVPLRGVEPSQVVLATRANDRNHLVAAFRRSAQAHLTGPRPVDPSNVPPTPSLS
jgi:DNA-binding transcriptional LysR family regulator